MKGGLGGHGSGGSGGGGGGRLVVGGVVVGVVVVVMVMVVVGVGGRSSSSSCWIWWARPRGRSGGLEQVRRGLSGIKYDRHGDLVWRKGGDLAGSSTVPLGEQNWD